MSLADGIQRRAVRAMLRLPEGVLRRVAGPPRLSDEGVTLELRTQALLALRARAGMDRIPSRAGSLRVMMDRVGRLLGPDPVRLRRVEDRTITLPGRELGIRVYVPDRDTPRPLPLTLFFHGGGYTIGSLESHDSVCRYLADRAGCVVAAVDYRLAPEHPFPAAVDDCLDAYRWSVDRCAELGVDPDRIAVCGDSAGATLATVVCLLVQRERHRPCFQALVYPATDFTRSFPSHRIFDEGLVVNGELLRYFTSAYLPEGQDRRDPRLSPLFAEDVSGAAAALVVLAGFDMLRDEGRAYVQRLRESGVQVTLVELADQTHGFFNMAGVVDEAGRALEEVALALERALVR